MDMLIAWGVARGRAGRTRGVFVWTRAIANPILRSLVRCLAAVWMLLPWSIQVVPGHYAPAFVVALFEGLFRDEGRAGPPLLALAAASLFVLAVFLVVSVVSRVRRRASSGAG